MHAQSQSCLTHWDPMDYSLPGSSVHGIFQLRIQEWVAIQLLLFSLSVMFNSLWPYERQHARLLCPSPSPWVCSNSCPLSQWCHPTVSSSVTPFSSCPQFFPASGSFPMSQLFALGDRSTESSEPCTKTKDPLWCKKIPHAVTKTRCSQTNIL